MTMMQYEKSCIIINMKKLYYKDGEAYCGPLKQAI